MARGNISLVAELLNLLWAHEVAKEGLCEGGQWWPEEVAVTFCEGGRKDERKMLAADAELSTLGPVSVTVWHVERTARAATDKLPLKRIRVGGLCSPCPRARQQLTSDACRTASRKSS
jgi:hypothetical protein